MTKSRYSVLRQRSRERGQVLILAVLAMVILTTAVLVLFDVQRIMRGKIKVMSGIDAAALTGAAWQKNSLNLIGELNLVKACDVLISDALYGIGGNPDDYMKLQLPQNPTPAEIEAAVEKARQELAQLKNSADMLTEMQVRIAFVGPLIGFGAAQQAAKNNGLPSNYNCNQYLIDLYGEIHNPETYGNPAIAPQIYYGYSWRMPYAAMIQEILGGLDAASATGAAVGTSVRHIGMPRLYTDPPTKPNFIAYLQMRIIFDAIAANDWCMLQALLDADYSGKWWGSIKVDRNEEFLGGSEILPIHVNYVTGQQVYDFANDAGYLDDAVKRKKGRDSLLVKLSGHYNDLDPVSSNGELNPDDADLKFNPLPSITWAVFGEQWRSYGNAGISSDDWEKYLRSGFREGMDYYSGALSYFSVSVPNRTLTRNTNPAEALRRQTAASDNGNPLWRRMGRSADRAARAQRRSSTVGIRFSATAKPFGILKAQDGSVHHPFAAAMVLPVFTQTALIPVALERSYGTAMDDRAWILYLTEFLPALGMSDTLEDAQRYMKPEHYQTVKDAGYIDLIRKLADPAWRAEGIRWLNSEATGYDKYDEYGNFIGHVTQTLNRDHCLDWGSGGGGYRTGPGELH
ncbi:MAG: pilus assembly protein TadG-related protein [Lentisphaeria bacterium]|nr:pilus assembly protein TadG-related protein [Lentisphaeria bacterium]